MHAIVLLLAHGVYFGYFAAREESNSMTTSPVQLFPYVIGPGDYLQKIAHRFGFDAETVWNDPKNEAFRRRHDDPNMLTPGEILYLPERAASGLPLHQGIGNRYVARVPNVKVDVVFQGVDGRPLAHEPYEIKGLGGSSDARGSSDDEGRVTLSVPVTLRRIDIVFPQVDLSFSIDIGGLDPENERTGIEQRLQNLGLLVRGAREDDDGEAFANALRVFQAKRGLPVTGMLDVATRAALVEEHSI